MLPDAIFLDTNVFDRHHYDFAGLALTTFAEACQRHNVPLILPDPIERELRRHVRKAATDALDLERKARRTAPFLRALRMRDVLLQDEVDEYTRRATLGLSEYLDRFTVTRVGYDGLNLSVLMDWYDSQSPPFGSAGKRKEFPDAFAIAIVQSYSST